MRRGEVILLVLATATVWFCREDWAESPTTQPTTLPAIDPRIAPLIHDLGVEGRGDAAIKELVHIGPSAVHALIVATNGLDDVNDRDAIRRGFLAMLVIKQIGAQAIPGILAEMNAREPFNGEDLFIGMGPASKEAVGPLIQMLKSPDWVHRLVAVKSLGVAGKYAPEQAVPALIGELHDAEVAPYAALALGDIGPAAAIALPDLILLLKSNEALTRGFAANALGKIGAEPKRFVPLLAGLLHDSDNNVCDMAIVGLGNFGPDGAEAIPELIAALKRDPSTNAGSISRCLSEIGPASVQPLIALRKDPTPAVRKAAASALEQCGTDAEPALALLVEALKDPDVEVRKSVIGAIGSIGPGAKPAVELLLPLANDHDPAVRLVIITAFEHIGPLAAAAVPAIARAIDDVDPQVQCRAVWALGAIHAHPDIAVAALLHAHDRYAPLRRWTSSAIGRFEKAGSAALPALLAIINSTTETDDDRRSALTAYCVVGDPADPAFHAVVVKALDDRAASVREVARGRIGLFTPPYKEAIPILLAILNNEHDDSLLTRCGAAYCLGQQGREAAAVIPALRRASQDVNAVVRFEAQGALLRIAGDDTGAIRAMAAAIDSCGSASWIEQGVAVRGLSKAYPHSPAAVAAIIKALHAPETFVRIDAAAALGDMGVEAKSAIPALRTAATDRAKHVRREAIVALQKLGATP